MECGCVIVVSTTSIEYKIIIHVPCTLALKNECMFSSVLIERERESGVWAKC